MFVDVSSNSGTCISRLHWVSIFKWHDENLHGRKRGINLPHCFHKTQVRHIRIHQNHVGFVPSSESDCFLRGPGFANHFDRSSRQEHCLHTLAKKRIAASNDYSYWFVTSHNRLICPPHTPCRTARDKTACPLNPRSIDSR